MRSPHSRSQCNTTLLKFLIGCHIIEKFHLLIINQIFNLKQVFIKTMSQISTINNKLIKLFSIIGKAGKVQNINKYYGQKWSEIKTDNETLNLIFEQVDDGDGIVQAKELNLLNKIFGDRLILPNKKITLEYLICTSKECKSLTQLSLKCSARKG